MKLKRITYGTVRRNYGRHFGKTHFTRHRQSRQRFLSLVLPIILVLLYCNNLHGADVPEPGRRPLSSKTDAPTTIIDLQPFRTVQSTTVARPGGTATEMVLINLNPKVNQWYILQLQHGETGQQDTYHLENPYPEHQRLLVDETSPEKLVLIDNDEVVPCPPWQFPGGSELETARKSGQGFAPLCGGKLYLRNPVKGHQTTIESVTDFLRDKLPGGEAVVGLVKDTLFKDAFLENTRTTTAQGTIASLPVPHSPAPAAIDPGHAGELIVPAELGIKVENSGQGMLTGNWYGVKNIPGVFVSLIQPKAIAAKIFTTTQNLTNPLDEVEKRALAYLVAFDLSYFELGFAVGTEHPRVGWSERTLEQMKDPNLPGPDGIGTIAPLVANGLLNPVEATRAVATFTGGFKRSHSAFKYGELAFHNHGSHYGFIENGVVLSTLQPGLATLLVKTDGTLEMKTWVEEDNRYLDQIVQARQNGVPLVVWDAALQQPVPGRLVTFWGRGNWSGSADEKLRTLRAGIGLQETGGRRFLIYGYFSTATPSAMARIFQAYNCRYAMHLDMNALEHTYLALYHREDDHLLVQHLISGMSVLDKSEKGLYIPRFLGYADNRDFFYVMARQRP